ncbi:MAG: asparagine synthase (glutamine-hydrolyzing), partial [Bacteroidetes bacterium]|nr:asparagine synthase (glutamine-hydrolyzing) [Bacteroidota bacterium]
GMWSFAIYDRLQHKLFLSRDRFAEKPLFFSETDDGFYFGSETSFIKILSDRRYELERKQLLRYLVNGYRSLYKKGVTYYQGISELDFANNMTIDTGLQKNDYRYWMPKVIAQKMTFEEAVEGARERLLESIKIRLRSDVPLAFCLSGGVDSAGLVSVASKVFNHKVASYSIIDDDKRYNEYDNMMATIDDIECDSTFVKLDNTLNYVEELDELIQYHDAPIATITYLIHSFLSKHIHADGYKVAFSGTAADEIFTGYYDHFNMHLYEMRDHPNYPKYLEDWVNNTGKVVRNPFFKDPEMYFKDQSIRDHIYLNRDVFGACVIGGFDEDFNETEYVSDDLMHNRMMNELFNECTRVILHEDDLNSMKYSVENRSPYLDSRLFEFAYSIPKEYLIQDGYGKYVLREALNGILNEHVRTDRVKKGFNASINSLFRLKDKEVQEYLLNKDDPVFEIVQRDKIMELFEMEEIPNSYSKFLFNFINLKLFLKQQQ